ncbi:MAG: hypothetical protein KGZ66_11250 [Selenomonadales bacterium]|nr:hypothetical protein [Selenomonadales bacterium]
MKKALSVLCLLLLLNGVITHAGANEPATLITVKVIGVDGQPVPQAYVSLWNHSTTPSTMVGSSYTSFEGVSVFTQPKYVDKCGQGVHLSVMVSAPGFEVGAWHWSVEQMHQSGKTAREGNEPTEAVTVTLRRPMRTSSTEEQVTQEIAPLATPPGTIRHRLVWWDDTTYANRLTTVATINQVGYLESSFAFRTNISTRLEVKRRVNLGVFQLPHNGH